MANFGHFDGFGQPQGRFTGLFHGKCRKIGKNTKNGDFTTPRGDMSENRTEFLFRAPIHATNFRVMIVWDEQKYKSYYGLSSCPVSMGIWPELKIDLRIMHHGIGPKGAQMTSFWGGITPVLRVKNHQFWPFWPNLRPGEPNIGPEGQK